MATEWCLGVRRTKWTKNHKKMRQASLFSMRDDFQRGVNGIVWMKWVREKERRRESSKWRTRRKFTHKSYLGIWKIHENSFSRLGVYRKSIRSVYVWRAFLKYNWIILCVRQTYLMKWTTWCSMCLCGCLQLGIPHMRQDTEKHNSSNHTDSNNNNNHKT